MAAPRKKWATGEGVKRDEFTSRRATYEWVQTLARSHAAGMEPVRHLTVWVDEGLGRGWELYETVDLADLAGMKGNQ